MATQRGSQLLRNVVVMAMLISTSCRPAVDKARTPLALPVGWQTAWSQQGQIVQTLEHTTIPALLALNAQFVPFQYGPDLNEAALTGKVKVSFAGIVPAVNLLARDSSWRIVGRFVDFPISIIARAGSSIGSIRDLKGKRFGVPIGGGSHPYAIASLKSAGLGEGNGANDVRIVNLPPTEMPLAMSQGAVDAVAVWDPTRSVLLSHGGRVIAETMYVGLVLAHAEAMKSDSLGLQRLLRSLGVASIYYVSNRGEVDGWFRAVSRLDSAVVANLPLDERNFRLGSTEKLSLSVDAGSLQLLQGVADEMASLGLIKHQMSISALVDNRWATSAEAWLSDSARVVAAQASVRQ